MRILIADDETLVRYGLVSVLQDILPPSTEIIEAENGFDMIEKTRKLHPHIAFIDIKMPGMDGLEAILQVQKYSRDTLWVILTGHGDFTYARSALKLGVKDFLLKPPDPDELKKLLKKLLPQIREKRIETNRRLESRISAVLGDTTSIEHDPYFQTPKFWQAALILWDSLLPDQMKVRIQQNIAVRLIDMLDDEERHSGTLVSMKDGRLLLVFSQSVERITMDRVIDDWNRQFSFFKSAIRNITGKEISDTWLLTRVTTNIGALFAEVEKLSSMVALRYLHHPGALLTYSQLIENHEIYRYLGIADLLENLDTAWKMDREDDFHGLVHKLKESVRLLPDVNDAVDDPAWLTQFVFPLTGYIPESLADLAQHLHNYGHELFENRRKPEKRKPEPHSIVDKAGIIMNRRYREAIRIVQIAEEIGVSPNYLSTVIKKETGQGFTWHLTRLRLDKSRELLKQPDANIGKIAQSLGYQSGRHFTRLFKDRFGITPSRWIANRRI